MSVYPILLHTVACGWYVFFWYQNQLSVSPTEDKEEWHPLYRNLIEFRFRFFTNWNLIMQTLYFSDCLLHDIMKILNGPNWLNLGTKFQNLLSATFASLILPSGIVVSATFWIFYNIDREVIYPEVLDNYIPIWQNHGMHTVVLLLVLAELITTKHRFLPVKVIATIFSSYIFFYSTILVATYVEKGRWLYPLFEKFSLPVAIAVIICFQFAFAGCLFAGIFIQDQVWGKEEKRENRKTVAKSE
ncbi:androgen-dependent TFPI-regulating protein-like [Adelges cooleyi]|uniref:androgen-dependent TFPI-regulating protein-like n=1 Tax=Adelges cooleyi TaxID=133065 RepID=UPI00218064C3|nr:androgen-dependent TFPI-regulating protein-like [Adelges cooleyi]XP_050426254.1 androgen-dependent TFPI-regulating protein-like [Adelges cooleyi]XP_050426255.1 androgen-dependent TFPI-regulating protein-like [Adelges cooleyi]XP_050426256.1 androgen-dependent TFPI-regulating protein-like [Adelges cooleyi]